MMLESEIEELNANLLQDIVDIFNYSYVERIYLTFIEVPSPSEEEICLTQYGKRKSSTIYINKIPYVGSVYAEIISSIIESTNDSEIKFFSRDSIYVKKGSTEDIFFIHSISNLVFFLTIEKKENILSEYMEFPELIHSEIANLIKTHIYLCMYSFFNTASLMNFKNENELVINIATILSKLFLPIEIKTYKDNWYLFNDSR
jgi:hypothetical protein